MSAMPIKHFDALSFVKKSKEFGVDERVAELQARQFEQILDIAITSVKEDLKSDELVTKGYLKENIKELELKIAETKNQIIIWVGSFILASGLIQHFFK